MHILALSYFLGLGAILAAGVKSAYLPWSRALVAIYLLLWAGLILTAQILSLFSIINVTSAYIILSFFLTAGISVGLRQIKLDQLLKFPEFPDQLPPRTATHIAWFLAGTFVVVLLADLVLAYGMLPANPDSIVYRFPRAYWYFGQGSLMHFTNSAEPRPLYYPFNGTLNYLPLIHFKLGPRSFTADSLYSWLVIGLTTYVFSRDLGGPRIAAAATAWLICLTPNVLIQSLSTNDEIIAAAPLLAGLFFLHRWFHGRQLFDALIGVVGVSISAGTKLHITFYWPLLLGITVALAVHHRAVLREAKNWLNSRAAAVFVTIILLAAIFSLSFIAYNFASAGRATAWEFSDQILNKPFNLRAALQTIFLYTSQIVLTPIADLHIAFDSADRARYYEAFNRVFAPLFTWVDNGPAFTSAFYRFSGINSPSAAVFNEQTVFIGLTWLIALMAGAWLISRWKDPRLTWARFHLVSLPVWAVTFAAMTRYIEGFTVYLTFATIAAAPPLVYVMMPIRWPRLDQLRWALLTFVATAHCFFSLSILLTSSPRNLIVLGRALSWPVSRGFAVDQSIEDEIGRAKAGVYHHSIAWGQPYWAFMAYHPEIPQFMSRIPNPIPVPPDAPTDSASVSLRYSRYVLMPRPGEPYLHVYSFPLIPAYGHAVPVHIPDKASPGLTLVGNLLFGLSPEWVFAAGNDVEKRHLGRDKYVVLPFSEPSDFGRDPEPIIRFGNTIYGLGQKDDIKFRFELRIDGKLTSSTEWQPTPQAGLHTIGVKADNSVLTVYVRNDDAGGTIYSTDVVLGSTKPLVPSSN